MQSGCRKKNIRKKHLRGQVQLKSAFGTGAAFNIELNSWKISVPEHQ